MPRIVVLNVKLLGALHWSQGRQVRMEDGSGAQEEPSLVGLRAQGLSRGGGGRTERMSLVQVSKCAAREADPPPPRATGASHCKCEESRGLGDSFPESAGKSRKHIRSELPQITP